MPRANRHYIPGCIWHITHRCHNKKFLLKYSPDRIAWLSWLLESKKRYGLCVLNYMVTCNHIHLLALDKGARNTIPDSIKLTDGRTAQGYTTRKQLKGSFWDDRYHATAVESGTHLARCMTYIDLNMVRAGAVGDPYEWKHCGYYEIQSRCRGYQAVDTDELLKVLDIADVNQLRLARKNAVKEAMAKGDLSRFPAWTESVAIGSGDFVGKVKDALGTRARSRDVLAYNENENLYVLQEPRAEYGGEFSEKSTCLSGKNLYPWNA